MAARAGTKKTAPSGVDLAYAAKAGTAVCAVTVSLIAFHGQQLTAFLAVSAILLALIVSDRRVSPWFYLVMGLSATCFEIATLAAGRASAAPPWAYADPTAFDVPAWLWPAWAIGGGGALGCYAVAEHLCGR
jgi:hypothetical protein